MKSKLCLLIIIPFLMGGGDSYPESPEQVVAEYLNALKNYDFPEAYGYQSDDMTRGMDSFNWAVEQKQLFKFAEVVIKSYKIYEAVVEGDKATVPNILSATDKYLNKTGVAEYEVYLLSKVQGDWYIDRQKLVDEKDRDKWFIKLVISSN